MVSVGDAEDAAKWRKKAAVEAKTAQHAGKRAIGNDMHSDGLKRGP